MGQTNRHRMSRRSLLRIGGGVAAAGAVGGVAAAWSSGGSADAASDAAAKTSKATAPDSFTHPGMLHIWGDLNRARARVAAGDDPWLSGWKRLTANGRSHSGWTPRPLETVVRGGGKGENYGVLYADIHAAYQNALRWHIGGTQEHADTARDILNAWSGTLKKIDGDTNKYLALGLYGWQFANAAELIRDYDGFHLEQFQQMMRDVFSGWNHDFLVRHNDTCDSHYWANWDLCNMGSLMAIGILCDDGELYQEALDYFYEGKGNGAIKNAVPFLHRDDEGHALGQWQESGRDQGHTVMGMGQMGAICEMAWSQGTDLYGYDDNRFMKAAQYVAKYNLGKDVPFTTYEWGLGADCTPMSHTEISPTGRGQKRPVWDMLHYHYTRRRRESVPYITEMAQSVRPEGGGGDYGASSGGYDQLGFGTLLYAK
ncbi:alginate lyase family protein [Streptomyces boncukensis]|uniref:Cell wall anchor protein n=1 Tax=Streptomyces boncukensis TaxID=2711219 RepID=A0A6G4WPL6_9ACTN|nr:alginate lyase family protein [Streptomyces boncukensis]NGO67206.1 cell wall anchor protein [Streptomyces boncukensis]